MSFLYPQTVRIERPVAPAQIGLQAYSAPAQRTVIGTFPASIQLKKEVGALAAQLPADVSRRTYWQVFIQAPNGTMRDRDILTDDQGIRYQVTGAYWTPLGYSALCERLEA